MITVQNVKDYLKIIDDSEDVLIQTMINQGYLYLEDAIDNYTELYLNNNAFNTKCDFWVLTQFIPTAYEYREGMTIGEKELTYSARAMITQLQLYK